MLLYQVHEQNNKRVNDTGGAIGLMENPAAFKRWMVSGPEQARQLSEFEDHYVTLKTTDTQNREQGASTQELVKTMVIKFCETINSIGNPFVGFSQEIMAIDNHNCLDEAAVNTLHTMEALGKEQ